MTQRNLMDCTTATNECGDCSVLADAKCFHNSQTLVIGRRRANIIGVATVKEDLRVISLCFQYDADPLTTVSNVARP